MPTLSRRTLVTSAAALPALAMPAAAVAAVPGSDPIFAAIEAHRRIWWVDLGQCSDLDLAASHGDEAAEQKLAEISEALDVATDALIDTAPTTNKGVAALLEYAADHNVENGTDCWPNDYRDGESWMMTLHRSLANALRNIATEA